ncbi:hypothetical protein JNK62_00270 [bacterium]|nr:hypothetical protein [bacterium]
MKWGIAIVVVIIAGAMYYFWQESHFSTRGERKPATQIQAEVKTRMSEDDPKKEIPEGVIMEDGTI